MSTGVTPRRAAAPLGCAAGLAPAACIALLLAAGCGGAGPAIPAAPDPTPGTTCPIPVAIAAPTFARDVLPALRQSCGAGDALTCHGTPSPMGHVSYAASLSAATVRADLTGGILPNAPPAAPGGGAWLLVAPGEPARSWLLAKVTQDDPGGAGQAYGNRMPLQAANLCDATVQTLTAWIAQGAVE